MGGGMAGGRVPAVPVAAHPVVVLVDQWSGFGSGGGGNGRYNLTFSLNFQTCSTTNFAPPVGNLGRCSLDNQPRHQASRLRCRQPGLQSPHRRADPLVFKPQMNAD